jgi:hypothetical protein
MMYVIDRKPVSICDTALAFFEMNSPYTLYHFEDAAPLDHKLLSFPTAIARIGEI